jgi:hypothetical protein
MNINMYDRPAPSNVINTYVPLPIDKMLQVGAMKQQAWDAAEAQELELSQTPDVKALRMVYDPSTGTYIKVDHYDKVTKYLQDFRNRVANVARDIGVSDKGSPLYRIKLQQLKRELEQAKSSTGILGAAQIDYEKYTKEIEPELRKNEHLQQNPWIANRLGSYLRSYFGNGMIGSLDSSIGLSEYVDPIEELKKQMPNLKMEVTKLLPPTMIDKETGMIMYGKVREIPVDRIKSVASSIIEGGKISNALKEMAINYYNRGLLKTDKDIEDFIKTQKENLYNFAVKGFYEGDANLTYKGGSGGLGGYGGIGSPFRSYSGPIMRNPTYNGKPVNVYKTSRDADPLRMQYLPGAAVPKTYGEAEENTPKAIEDFKNRFNLHNYSQEQIVNMFNNYVESTSSYTDRVVELPRTDAKIQSERIFGTPSRSGELINGNLKAVVVNSKGRPSNLMGWTELAKELGYKRANDLEKTIHTGSISEAISTPEMPFGYVGTVKNSSGKYVKIIIQGPEEMQSQMKLVSTLKEKFLQGKEDDLIPVGVVKGKDGNDYVRSYRVKNDLQIIDPKNGLATSVPRVEVMLKNTKTGEVKKEAETTLEAIESAAYESLTRQGYIQRDKVNRFGNEYDSEFWGDYESENE